jgi:phospholipid/cholesterol/gamma-HCH transport system substrate-binding protein
MIGRRELKVGLFVIFGLALTMLAVFLVGDIRRLWDRKVEYGTSFEDVAGLKPGAPVRMGGLDIGTVTRIGHDHDLSDTRIYVRMSIIKREAARIRTDTVAHVVNKGLLGDKMVELTIGSPQKAMVPAEALIASEEPADMFAEANKLAATTEKAISELQPLARALGDPKLAEDIKGSAADLHALLDSMVLGDGPIHRLFFDRREANQIDELVSHLNQISARVDSAIADVQDVTSHVRQGPGIAHALVYDGEISKSVGGSVHELHEDLRAIREGNGLAHALLYGDSSSQHVMSNLNSMSDDLRAIVAGLREGKGTLGGLLVDPTVYEDIKSLVGNVERNEVLRALVRYSIKADERRSGLRGGPAPQ